jgi:hypothetical protein
MKINNLLRMYEAGTRDFAGVDLAGAELSGVALIGIKSDKHKFGGYSSR